MLYQLSYFRKTFAQKVCKRTLIPSLTRNNIIAGLHSLFQLLWAKMDSNHRRRKPADLQSAPFGHSGICPNSLFQKTHLRSLKENYRFQFRASCRIRTNDPEITNHVLWPTELKRRRNFHQALVACLKRLQMYCFFLNYKSFSDFFSIFRAFFLYFSRF